MSSEKAVDANTNLGHSGIREIGTADLRDALARGIADFMEQPTHLIFLCAIYPVVGLFVARLAAGYDILPLLFPLVAGFSLIGPLAATGLYELSRRREQGLDLTWWHVFDVLHSPSRPAIVVIGVAMAAIFVAWLVAAQTIFVMMFGDWVPASIGDFSHEVFATSSGWALIIVGVAGGQVFNLFVLRNFIEDLPKDLFEAAEMDGASHFQQVINIVDIGVAIRAY